MESVGDASFTDKLAFIKKRYDDEKLLLYNVRVSWFSKNITIYKFGVLSNPPLIIDHSHKYKEICFILSGTGFAIVGGTQKIPLCGGSLIYLNNGVIHRLLSDANDAITGFTLSFSFAHRTTFDAVPDFWIADELLLLEKLERHAYLFSHQCAACNEEIFDIVASIENDRRGEFIKVKNHLSNLLMSAIQTVTGNLMRVDANDTHDKAVPSDAKKIINYISNHYTQEITLPVMADELHYSPRQCQRIIREVLGITFSELVMDFRLSYAKRLLYDHSRTIEKIAGESGFKNSRTFNQKFTKKIGITPTQYREQITRTLRDSPSIQPLIDS